MLRLACGLSGHVHPVKAVEQVTEQCAAGLGGAKADLVMVFFSPHHVEAARAIGYALRRRMNPQVLLGVSAEAVLAGEREVEDAPAISLFAASLPGVDLHIFRTEMLMNFVSSGDSTGLAAAAGFTPAARASIILADPFSVPFNTLLPALAAIRPPPRNEPGGIRGPRMPIVGGLASSARQPGGNTLLLDDQLLHEGGVGVTLSGRVRVDTIVSQGCRAVGPPMIVTGGKGQIISSLGGRSALKAITEVVESLDHHGAKLMQRGGLFIGRAVDEYKSRFGRDDFLMRPILSVDRASESVAVGDLLRVGQTVQLHVRDAETAHEDLQMLLDKQRLHEPAAGALLFTCNGRGRRMFDVPDHDASTVARTFASPNPGEQQARGGEPINHPAQTIPVAGFMAGGEIGPLGDGVFVHGQTAVAAFFRSVPPPADV